MGRKLGNMGNWFGGVLVAGNELSEVDTLKSLAKTALNSGEVVGEIIGSGVLANVEELADEAYVETVEMLALYLATLVDVEDDDEGDEDENDDAVCGRCGVIIPEDEDGGDYIIASDAYVCYKCMSAEEYRNQ